MNTLVSKESVSHVDEPKNKKFSEEILTLLEKENSAIKYLLKKQDGKVIDQLNYTNGIESCVINELKTDYPDDVLIIIRTNTWNNLFSKYKNCIVFFHSNNKHKNKEEFKILNYGLHAYVYISNFFYSTFSEIFCEYIEKENFKWDNLFNLVMIVKNSGELLREVLLENKKWIDEWTILDTGSTDGTQKLIKEIMENKRGHLYEEPFINFRDSRNRAFDLAGKSCVYNLVLDDSYIIKNGEKLRELLTAYRNNIDGRTFSVKVMSKSCSYDSCRITRSDLNIRYASRVHEYIDDIKPSFVFPHTLTYLWDQDNKYMEGRTKARMSKDLEFLFEDLNETPTNPRHSFYIGQSYTGLEDWEKSLEWYEKRINSPYPGFDEEIYNSMIRIAIISELKLKLPWEKCHQLYIRAFQNRPHRAEPLALIADYYSRNNSNHMAYLYLKRAIEIPFPEREGLFVDKHFYDYEIPYMLSKLSYEFQNYKLGEKCATLAYKSKPSRDLEEWAIIYQYKQKLEELNPKKEYKLLSTERKILCIVTDGNFYPWNGDTPNKKGLGGSEYSAVRFAEELSKCNYKVFIFCNCADEKENLEGTVKNVTYIDINKYIDFVATHNIDICIVLRYNIYLPLSYGQNVKNVYLWLQDITPLNSNLILDYSKVRGILTLTKWHKEKLETMYNWIPKSLVQVTSNAIDIEDFKVNDVKKIPYSFIYSSFPDRGLYYLLKNFPKITNKYPQATLKIFCNLELDVFKRNGQLDMINEIKKMIDDQCINVTNYGWTNKKLLIKHWLSTEIWLYPCTFEETACITALESAASKTIPICPPLAALAENAVNGILIPGDPRNDGWWIIALNEIDLLYKNPQKIKDIQTTNYSWVFNNKTYKKITTEWVELFDKNNLQQ